MKKKKKLATVEGRVVDKEKKIVEAEKKVEKKDAETQGEPKEKLRCLYCGAKGERRIRPKDMTYFEPKDGDLMIVRLFDVVVNVVCAACFRARRHVW